MRQLIVRDMDGQDLINRPLEPGEQEQYYAAWMEKDLVSFAQKRYQLHSVAKTKPQEDCLLLVSFDSWEGSCDC